MLNTPISPAVKKLLQVDREAGLTPTEIAAKRGVSRATVLKYTSQAAMPDPAPEAGGPSLPDPVSQSYDPYTVDTPGRWLVLCDLHIPYHDKRTISEAVAEAERVGVAGVLLNGDVLDCYQLSAHYKEPDKGRFAEEVEKGRQFVEWLRSRLRKARIIYKEGNHDERLRRYLAERAPALFDLPEFHLQKVMGAEKHGVEWVSDKRIVQLGKLPVLHGHEFRGGGGVNPARWLFLRSVSTALCGHFHRTSEHHEQGLDRRVHGVWSVGCACYLHPAYDPNCKWNHGYATVQVEPGGMFSVNNRRLLRDGKVV